MLSQLEIPQRARHVLQGGLLHCNERVEWKRDSLCGRWTKDLAGHFNHTVILDMFNTLTSIIVLFMFLVAFSIEPTTKATLVSSCLQHFFPWEVVQLDLLKSVVSSSGAAYLIACCSSILMFDNCGFIYQLPSHLRFLVTFSNQGGIWCVSSTVFFTGQR